MNMYVSCLVHPGKLTWNTIMEVWKMISLFKGVISRFHVNFPGCKRELHQNKFLNLLEFHRLFPRVFFSAFPKDNGEYNGNPIKEGTHWTGKLNRRPYAAKNHFEYLGNGNQKSGEKTTFSLNPKPNFLTFGQYIKWFPKKVEHFLFPGRDFGEVDEPFGCTSNL